MTVNTISTLDKTAVFDADVRRRPLKNNSGAITAPTKAIINIFVKSFFRMAVFLVSVAGVNAMAETRYTMHVNTIGFIVFRVGFARVVTEPKHSAESTAAIYPKLRDLKFNISNQDTLL